MTGTLHIDPGTKERAREGSVVGGRYRLRELIGAGGFGEVWRASYEAAQGAVGEVAVKLMPRAQHRPEQAHKDPAWLNEVQAIRNVKSAAIVQIYDFGESNEPWLSYIAMELLEGETLKQRLERRPVYWRRALTIARHIALALQACHENGVFHCDLKPQNVFVTRSHQIRVLDFGVAALSTARAVQRQVELSVLSADASDETARVDGAEGVAPSAGERRAIQLIGTAGYIPPEGFSGDPPSAAGDVYALGVTLYQLITGQLPYRVEREIIDAVRESKPNASSQYRAALNAATTRRDLVPILSLVPDLPAGVAALIESMLAGDPAKRPTRNVVASIEETYQRPYGIPADPYVGLDSFKSERAGWLAGREGDVEHLATRLEVARSIVLCGPSGCGKSSLAIAGVAARVDELLLDGLDGWQTLVVRPRSFEHSTARERSALLDLDSLLAQTLAKHPSVGVVLVVDQLEEVLNLSETARAEFCAALARLAAPNGSSPAVRLVATVRADLFGRVAEIPQLERFPEQNLYTVRGVEPNAMAAIVVGPAKKAQYEIEDAAAVTAAVSTLLEDDSSALPLVQFALTRWWELRDATQRRLTKASWEQIGGIEGALAQAAASIYDQLAEEQQPDMKRLLIMLFSPNGLTRVGVPYTDAERVTSKATLDRLFEARLIRMLDREDGKAILEVTHEALSARWPLLKRWLQDSYAGRLLSAELERDASLWLERAKPNDMLWRGSRLAQTAEITLDISPGAAEFLAESSRLEASQRTRATFRSLIVGTVIAVFGGLLFVGTFIYLGYRASMQAALAERTTLLQNAQNDAAAVKQTALADKKDAEAKLQAAQVALFDLEQRKAVIEADFATTKKGLDKARDDLAAARKETKTLADSLKLKLLREPRL